MPRITCEAQAVREARSYLLTDRGLPRPRVTTRGYWRVGAANHPDHDSGED
ncbi:siderophore-interacting protein [Streptomyces cellulosae]|uniref:SIP domain-containing protein n=1 Tax=unclassified Streptomyces TaxID=2593676 RepID=UPI000381D349|nr:siderophore-interacting protein [Streptomyces cellulosae]WTB71910.1 siderophore-interacting protein [Streptomyces cellulosae]WUC45021.1 siderophore-interacting protein [Streptomyces cellulosae]